jgi:hypothetical protein
MQQPPNLTGVMIQGAVELLRIFMSSSKVTVGSLPPDGEDAKSIKVCDRCTIHAEVSSAYGILKGIVENADAGREPQRIERAIELTRQHLTNAEVRLPDAAMLSPEATDIASNLVRTLTDTEKELLLDSSLVGVRKAYAICEGAVAESYKIQEQVLRPPSDAETIKYQLEQAQAEIQDLRQEVSHGGTGERGQETRPSRTPD